VEPELRVVLGDAVKLAPGDEEDLGHDVLRRRRVRAPQGVGEHRGGVEPKQLVDRGHRCPMSGTDWILTRDTTPQRGGVLCNRRRPIGHDAISRPRELATRQERNVAEAGC
jgi:hypothetical protein